MKTAKIKKEVNYRLGTMATSEAMAGMFFLHDDDQELINRINNGDESALLQFAVKHLNMLTRDIIRWGCRGIEKELMNVYLPAFCSKIKIFADQHKDKLLPEDWQYQGLYNKALKMGHELVQPLIDEKYKIWRNYQITGKHIDFLSGLNEFLIKTEEAILARAKMDIPMLEARIKESGATTSDYEYFVDIDYLTESSNGTPIYTATHSFNTINIEQNHWGVLCDGEDWRESGWLPILKTRCCYLMHELVYHAKLAHYIFDITDIWIETKIWDQSRASLKSNIWETIKDG